MKSQSKAFLAVAALLVVGVLVFSAQQSGLRPQSISGACLIQFCTTPGSCTVTFNGVTKTSSATAGAALSFGYFDSTVSHTYSYSVSKSGYTTKTGTVITLFGALVDTVTVTLTASGGGGTTTYSLTVTTSPASCSVVVNGVTKDSGTSGAVFTGLNAGTYSIAVSKTGYTSQTVSASISTASVTKSVTLSASGSGGGGGTTPPTTDQKPITPSITYPPTHTGYVGDVQSFGLNAWDPDTTDKLQYRVDWGTGAWSGWTAFAAGEQVVNGGYVKASKTISHTWTAAFSGSIRVESMDSAGTTSDIYTYAWSAVEKPNYDLTVTTTPSDCDVSISGYGTHSSSGGSTTFTLPLGTYTVSVSKRGYISDSMSVDLTEGAKSVPFELMVITYKVTVTTSPTGCDVTFNGQTRNTGTGGYTFVNVLPGIYPITISKAGFVAKSEQVTIIDADKSLTETLDQIKVTLTVMTIPTNCDVTIGATTMNSGTTGALFQNMIPGSYSIQASKQYYMTASGTATIVDIAVTKTITLSKANFNLTILTVPPNCDVIIDSVTKASGATGNSKFDYLLKGTHTLTVSKEEYKTNTTTINLQADNVIRVHLTGQTYVLTVNVIPSDCSISILNGETKTSTNGLATFDLEKGTYQVTASKTGYAINTRTITITNLPTTMYFNLTPAHIVTIITEPPGAIVNITGVGQKTSDAEGKAIFFNVEQKTYTVTVKMKGYKDLQSPLVVDKDTTATFSLEKGTVKTPGFELLSLIVAVGIAYFLLKKKKNKQR